jgi:acyl-CoA dehydrogenase
VKVPAADVLVGPAEGPGGRPEGQADGRAAVAFVTLRAQAALSALALGLAGKQIEMVSEYVIRRSQFGKPIGLFQAVAQRAANAYIDAEAMRLSLWQAVWRLEENLPAEQPVAVARYWSAEGGHRIASTAQHLHGGMGFDKNYPLARYYLLAKQTEVTLGGASPQLERLGALISVQGAQPA